jgi:hypothetical protein
MKVIYNKPINQQIRDLEIREHDWRPIRVRLKAQGCIPSLSFEMSLTMARNLPPSENWPNVTGNLDAMFEAKVDPRFLMSEIIRYRLDPKLFSECVERTPRFGKEMLYMLVGYRAEHPEVAHLDAYIEEAQQVFNSRRTCTALDEVGRA